MRWTAGCRGRFDHGTGRQDAGPPWQAGRPPLRRRGRLEAERHAALWGCVGRPDAVGGSIMGPGGKMPALHGRRDARRYDEGAAWKRSATPLCGDALDGRMPWAVRSWDRAAGCQPSMAGGTPAATTKGPVCAALNGVGQGLAGKPEKPLKYT